ncbi:MAG: ABC transporter permease, partial [Thermoprotei archaeon]
SPGYGYTGIVIAWLGGLNPLGVAIAAFLYSGLLVGGDALQVAMGLPQATVNIFNGSILFFILAFEFLTRYEVKLKR